MVEKEEYTENLSDDEVNQGAHSKLLNAVSRIYKKQRVDKPKRSEPYANVSEYHLSNYENSESNQEKIQVFDLVNVLNRKSTHQKIKSKFDSVKDRSSKLPKPLEKVYADRIKRAVGYEHLKQHVSRWNELVQSNRAAPQLSFPLRDESQVEQYKPLEFLHTFKEPTELEKNMAELLQKSSVAQLDSQVEEAIYDLSIPEMIEKRKLMAKLKAKESFKIVKAMKQNKIKSKKYRRILRKEKLKQELKDFDTLQKTDPEAALEKLNKLEKERAEERASLRHRNTGKWARGQAIRAKYDKDARIQLAEQISKSRELTQKRKLGGETSSEEDEEDDEGEEGTSTEKQSGPIEQDDNPWTQDDQEQTVDDFIAGYQSYWKNKKNQLPEAKPTINKAALARLVGKDKVAVTETQKSPPEEDAPKTDDAPKIDDAPKTDDEPGNNAICEQIKTYIDLVAKISTPKDSTNEISNLEPKEPIVNVNESQLSVETPISNKNGINVSKKKSLNVSNNNINMCEIDQAEVLSSKDVLSQPNSSNKKTKLNKKKNKTQSSSQTPSPHNKKRKSAELNSTRTSISNVSGLWEVTPDKPVKKKKKSLDDLFDRMEGDMQDRVRERLRKFDGTSNDTDEEESTNINITKKKKSKKDDKKERVNSASIIDERTNDDHVERDNGLDSILKVIEGGDKTETDSEEKKKKEPAIDPNKFLNVKPRVLNAQVPDMLTEGDDMVDDPEDDRRVKISEAFAEDDVVEEFQKEKEEEVKNSEGQDVDLFLPGWGSWGGPSVQPSKTKKKKNRFFIKAPEMKRKDATKPNVIINEDISDKYKQHMVNEVPYPFTGVRDYEASIRAPIGSTWVPETAVNKLTRPPVVRKIGTVIEPITEASLVKHDKKKSSLKVNNIQNNGGSELK